MTYMHSWIYSILKSLEISKSMWKVQMNDRSLNLGFKERNKSSETNKTIIQPYTKTLLTIPSYLYSKHRDTRTCVYTHIHRHTNDANHQVSGKHWAQTRARVSGSGSPWASTSLNPSRSLELKQWSPEVAAFLLQKDPKTSSGLIRHPMPEPPLPVRQRQSTPCWETAALHCGWAHVLQDRGVSGSQVFLLTAVPWGWAP